MILCRHTSEGVSTSAERTWWGCACSAHPRTTARSVTSPPHQRSTWPCMLLARCGALAPIHPFRTAHNPAQRLPIIMWVTPTRLRSPGRDLWACGEIVGRVCDLTEAMRDFWSRHTAGAWRLGTCQQQRRAWRWMLILSLSRQGRSCPRARRRAGRPCLPAPARCTRTRLRRLRGSPTLPSTA